MAIWLRAREEFANNRFQLLFIGASLSEPHTDKFRFCRVYTVVSRLLVPIAICSLHSITRHVINERHSSS